MATRITVYEVGPRDGLQNEARVVPTDGKLALVSALVDAGLTRIEAASFVSPRWIPALADSAELVERLPTRPGVQYVALVPNGKGLERLLAARGKGRPAAPVDAAVFLSASETHNKMNVNKTVADTLHGLRGGYRCLARARGQRGRARVRVDRLGLPLRGPGRSAPKVLQKRSRERLLELGCYQVSLGDTIGVGTPKQTRDIVRRFPRRDAPTENEFALHLHDTRGTALANVLVGLEMGVRDFRRFGRRRERVVPTRPARPATSRPKIWCSCSTAWA